MVSFNDFLFSEHANFQRTVEDYRNHPCANQSRPHPLLYIYDPRIYPEVLSKTLAFVQFMNRPVGEITRQLNSTLGVPWQTYRALIASTVSCSCCNGHFSLDGFNAHIKDGRCTNHPDTAEGVSPP